MLPRSMLSELFGKLAAVGQFFDRLFYGKWKKCIDRTAAYVVAMTEKKL